MAKAVRLHLRDRNAGGSLQLADKLDVARSGSRTNREKRRSTLGSDDWTLGTQWVQASSYGWFPEPPGADAATR